MSLFFNDDLLCENLNKNQKRSVTVYGFDNAYDNLTEGIDISNHDFNIQINDLDSISKLEKNLFQTVTTPTKPQYLYIKTHLYSLNKLYKLKLLNLAYFF